MKKQTKIVCTIGPASETYECILKMAQEGMNIVRLNFSHGSYEEHQNRINLVREVCSKNPIDLGIMLDTKGPEIRLGEFENDKELYKIGEVVTVVKEKIMGTHDRFHIQCPELFDDIQAGNYILVNDGKQRMTVIEVRDGEFDARIEVNGYLSSKKGCNVPGVKLSMPFLSKKDDEDIRFGCRNDVDYIAASFVRRADDVLQIRKILEEMGKPEINIIAKIENEEGFQNIDEILTVADGVMVARGDLGVEVETAYVPIYQKKIISAANKHGKPVITATHMLDSMTSNPRCTRAEASDVANAVLDGTDAVMLSAESAAGDYPVEAVRTMAQIVEAAEQIIPFKERLENAKKSSNHTIQDAIGFSISESAYNLNVAAIIAFTQGGTTARRISKYRPSVPVYAVTFSESTKGKLAVCWGVHPVVSAVQNELTNDDELASQIAKSKGIQPGELIIISAGYPVGEGSANLMKIVEVK